LTVYNGQTSFETAILLPAVWWVWTNTVWLNDWLEPDHLTVQTVVVMVMLGSLVMSAAVPGAFDGYGLVFGGIYAGVQVGRTLSSSTTPPPRSTTLRPAWAAPAVRTGNWPASTCPSSTYSDHLTPRRTAAAGATFSADAAAHWRQHPGAAHPPLTPA
jgi:hypothetical protein